MFKAVSLTIPILALALINGCAGSLGQIGATDPTERGCSYIAAAIVTSAVLRMLFND